MLLLASTFVTGMQLSWTAHSPASSVTERLHLRRSAISLIDAVAAPEFDSYERECFGNAEEGCDAWYYGEDPNSTRSTTILPSDEQLASLKAAGQAALDLRKERDAQAQEVLERLRMGVSRHETSERLSES
uniref:Uncharacterized protein n=1 Tax=Coccolithus braarudii TaxID=221442 RepID=A0A7S0L962_9EUKA